MIVAFSVQPTGAPSDPSLARDLGEGADAASVHDAVAAAVRIVRESGLPTRTSSMFTNMRRLGHGQPLPSSQISEEGILP